MNTISGSIGTKNITANTGGPTDILPIPHYDEHELARHGGTRHAHPNAFTAPRAALAQERLRQTQHEG
jgi:hypothetical protein